jgi:hypothetical protein
VMTLYKPSITALFIALIIYIYIYIRAMKSAVIDGFCSVITSKSHRKNQEDYIYIYIYILFKHIKCKMYRPQKAIIRGQ